MKSTLSTLRSKTALIAIIAALLLIGLVAWATIKTSSPSADTMQRVFVSEIHRTLTVPPDMGTVTYKMNGPNSILLFSSAYEKLATQCKGHHIAELLLSDTLFDPDVDIDIGASSEHQYAHPIFRPMGACAGNTPQERALYAVARTMFQDSNK